jgi:hypothetical protein
LTFLCAAHDDKAKMRFGHTQQAPRERDRLCKSHEAWWRGPLRAAGPLTFAYANARFVIQVVIWHRDATNGA